MLRLSNKVLPLTRQIISPVKFSFSSEVADIIKQKTTDTRLFEHFDVNFFELNYKKYEKFKKYIDKRYRHS